MNEAKQFRCHDYVFELCGDTEQVDELEELFVDLATPTVPDAHIWTIEVEKGRARVVIDVDLRASRSWCPLSNRRICCN